jgi:small subunit ribosomal protein S6
MTKKTTASDDRTLPYEGMFLFSQAQSAALQEAVDHLEEILKRAEAEIISLRKWDERRLAYEIKGNKRGVYFLVYFRARPDALAGIERNCNLSEKLLRSMIVRAEHIPQELMESADGRAQLADEIKLRSESAEAGAETPKAESEPEENEPVEVRVEHVAPDASRVER